jgi:uncharacterized protein
MKKNAESLPYKLDCGILLSDIHKSGTPFKTAVELRLDGSVEYWGQSYIPYGPVRVDITANYARGDIDLHARITCEFLVPCARCLEETRLAINCDMRYLFTTRRSSRTDEDSDVEKEDGYIDAIEIEKFETELDLSPYIWETIILNLPEKVLCREDCKGLCPFCGCSRNIRDCDCAGGRADPRFEVLKDFL